MKKTIVILLVALVAVSGVMAGRSVDETRAAAPDGTVTVELISGEVTVVGWSRDEVRVTGVLGDDVEDLEIDSDGDEVSIEVVLPDRDNLRNAHADLEIQVPLGSQVEVEAVTAPISVEGVTGPVVIESVVGDIEITGSIKEVEIEAVNGSITLTSDSPLRRAEFETVSGNIEVSTALDSNARLSIEALSGNIELRLPSDTSADFDISTFSGDIESAFGGTPEEAEYLPSKTLELSIGSGGARVTIEAFSGNIELIKQ